MPQQEPDPASISTAARALERGELVAFPTETVYGLGADAENPQAVAKIYAAKGRPADHPVIVHLAPVSDISYWASDIPAVAHQLMQAFWPGPLTIILKRAASIPDAVSGGQGTIGLRCPAHPVAQALLRAFKAGRGGLAAPSANRFGHVSPTTAQHVMDEFGRGAHASVAMVLDGGQSEVGIESTILDLSRMTTHGPVLLRPGRITPQQIADVIGYLPASPDVAAPRASGTLESHYAPATPVVIVPRQDLAQVLARLKSAGRMTALLSQHYAVDDTQIAFLLMPGQANAYAHDLYAALRKADTVGADVIVVEALPDTPDWQGVNDRLKRAAHGSQKVLERLI